VKASMAAKVKVTQRSVGARSITDTAVGSRPKLNTVSTRAVNTTAETMAVRVRNSSSRSLRATVHACRSSSSIGHGTPVGGGDLGGAPRTARREVHEPPASLERDVRGELDSLIHVVRRAHQHATPPSPPAAQLAQQRAPLFRRREDQPRDRPVE